MWCHATLAGTKDEQMAGHSHWAGIKHRKAAQDKKRSRYFSKFSKAIMIAAREGGGDPDQNLGLRYAIDRAKAGNMPKDAISRAVKKGSGELGDVQFHEIMYEGYGPGGVAIMCEILTDNRNRTAPEMRRLFSSSGGNLGTPGSVQFMFERKGLIALEGRTEDEVLEVALEAGAEDVEENEGTVQVTTAVAEFHVVMKALTDKGWELSAFDLVYVSETPATPPLDAAPQVEDLLEKLEDHEDVQAVHTNYQPPEEE